jgi:multiple sugar transport system permease protein
MSAPGSTRRRWTLLVGFLVLLLGLLLYLGPFFLQVANSFKTDPDATANPVALIPDPFTTDAWKTALGRDPTVDSPVPRWIANSFFVTTTVTLGRVLLASLAGYALARLKFRGRGIIDAGLIAVMAVPAIVLLIPKFLVLNRLGIWDSYWAMTIPLFADAVGILLMKTAFEAVPIELEEAARVDGAGIFTRFWRIMLPLTGPALIAVTILSFQGTWNEFTFFLVATQDPDLATLNLGIARLTAGSLGQGQQFPLKLALATLSILPIAIVYVFASRRFTRSIASTGIK